MMMIMRLFTAFDKALLTIAPTTGKFVLAISQVILGLAIALTAMYTAATGQIDALLFWRAMQITMIFVLIAAVEFAFRYVISYIR